MDDVRDGAKPCVAGERPQHVMNVRRVWEEGGRRVEGLPVLHA